MKQLTLLVAVLLLFLSSFAQDIIVTKDGGKIEVVISEIELEIVKYKRFDNQTGPTISIRKSEIASIIYQNGSVEVFKDKPTIPALSEQTRVKTTDYLQSQEYISAKKLRITGAVIAGVGSAVMLTGLIVGLVDDLDFVIVGFGILMPIGAGMALPGIICEAVGHGRMNAIARQNSYLYSHNLLKTEKSQLSLTINPNSIGFSLKF